MDVPRLAARFGDQKASVAGRTVKHPILVGMNWVVVSADRVAGTQAFTRRDPVSRLAAEVPGVGALAASAILASAPNPHLFESGRDFAAWLGVTPKQNSTGGKEKLGSITKQGNRYIRRLLVLGAISVLRARQSARARCATGWPRSERASRQRSWPWRWPTGSPGSSGRSSPPPRLSAAPSAPRPDPTPGNALERRTQAQEFGERDDDAMDETARRSETIGHSAMGKEPKARSLDQEPRVVGLHQGQRI
jgi:hypothetical protein